MMNDMADIFNDIKDRKRKLRAAFGIKCPLCTKLQPKGHASILLPGQYCKVDGYRDARSKLTTEQKKLVMKPPGS